MTINDSDLIKFKDISANQNVYSTNKLSGILNDMVVSKISVETSSGVHSKETEMNPLSIVYTDIDTYVENIQGTTRNIPNALYLVELDNLNGFNKRIINVGAPALGSDAANKLYADSLLNTNKTCSSVFASSGNQYSNLVSADVIFDKLLNMTNNSFELRSLTLETHYGNTTISSDTVLSDTVMILTDSSNNVLARSNPLGYNAGIHEFATFVFPNTIVLNTSLAYKIALVDSSGAPRPSALRIGQQNYENLNTYYGNTGTSVGAWCIYIYKIEIDAGTKYKPLRGIVINDTEQAGKKYLVRISNGNFNITPLS